MTPVEFHFVLPNGEPFANSSVQIQLAASSYTTARDGIAVPREINFVTDGDGRARLELWPSTTLYYVSVEDAVSDAGLSYKFIVPEVSPGTVVRLQDIVIDAPMSGTFYDDAALLIIQDAKANALASANAAAASADQITTLLTTLGLQDGVLGGVTDGDKGDVNVVGGVWQVPGLNEVAAAAATDASTKANTARTAAISAAAIDATTKANNAQATATTTAAADATTKASAAQATAIAAAATDASTKAAAAQAAAIGIAAADATTKASNRLLAAEKGTAGGVAPLGSDSKVPAAYLPAYVSEVQEYPNLAAFPAVGSTGIIYLRQDVTVDAAYRWSGTQYFPITDSPGSTDAVVEGASNLYFTQTRARTAAVQAGPLVASTVVAPNTTAVQDGIAAALVTAAADATAKSNSARVTAISTAAADASTKATAAQTAAIAAAAIDATAKAGAAQATAISTAATDATTKVSVAQTAAAVDATTKASAAQTAAIAAASADATSKSSAAQAAAIAISSADATAKANSAKTTAVAEASALITFKGVWRGTKASEVEMFSLTNPVIGDKVQRVDQNDQVFELIALPANTLSNWLEYGTGSGSSSGSSVGVINGGNGLESDPSFINGGNGLTA